MDIKKIAGILAGIAAGVGLIFVVVKKAAAAANIVLGDLIISPDVVVVGDTVEISVTATNIGTKVGSKTITCEVDGGIIMAEKIVTLAPGESVEVVFPVTPEVAKAYAVLVNGLEGSFVATEVPVVDIRVENLVIEPPEVLVGETVNISVTATNYGTAAGSKTIVCEVV